MTITARYIDTCLSDYLQDGYTRAGQSLCFAPLGCSIEETVEALASSVDGDSTIPECYEEIDLEIALKEAIGNVDLRYIDEDGTRQDEPADDRDSEEANVYVVLEWDATDITMVLSVEVDYLANGVHSCQLKERLEDIIRQASGNGAITGGLDASVISWGASAHVKGEEPGTAATSEDKAAWEKLNPDVQKSIARYFKGR